MKPCAQTNPLLPLLAPLFALCPLAAFAQAAPAAPNAGSILQQVQPLTPPPPPSTRPGLTIEQDGRGKLPPSVPFAVKALRLSGNTLFDTPTLHALVAEAEGKHLTLAQLDELAARITDYYHSHGYPLARAIIPAQVIRDGVVVIEIIEARYGKISLDNQTQVKTSLLEATLAPLQSGRLIGQADIDHALLLLSDIPGVVVNATLKPGERVGTSDLMVATVPAPAVTGSVTLDNYGSRYTGRGRVGGMVSFNNALHHGDVLSLSGMTSESRGVDYGRMSYETLLNGRGTRLGGAYSALSYTLGDTLASLKSHGTAEASSLWARHPLARGDFSLYVQVQYDQMQMRDHIDASAIRTDRSVNNASVSLSGDTRKEFLSGGINAWTVSWTTGHVGFDDGAAQLADAATARTQGAFSKWNASFSRLQGLSSNNTLYLSLYGQWANNNLDSSKKLGAGGPYTVRAYDMGAISGDSGYLGSVEFRHTMEQRWNGQWEVLAFIDSAQVEVNKTTWAAGTNSATLSGAGVGFNWSGSDQWYAKAYLATPVGATPELLASNTATRAWIEIGKRF